MYNDGDKALIMVGDSPLKEQLADYLEQRYNLETDTAEGLLEVFNLVNESEKPYELIILDEQAAGIPATSHAIKTIKDQSIDTNVLYLSNVLELFEPYAQAHAKLAPDFIDPDYRLLLSDEQMERRLAMHFPLTKVTTLEEVYATACRRMEEVLEVDWTICTILRTDENPITRGIVVENFPKEHEERAEFLLNGSGPLQELVDYFRPIHIPNMEKEEAFAKEMKEKFGSSFRSALLVPMQFEGHCIGFLGAFTKEESRLYNLVELDFTQRLADMATVAIIAIFSLVHQKVKLKPTDERILS